MLSDRGGSCGWFLAKPIMFCFITYRWSLSNLWGKHVSFYYYYFFAVVWINLTMVNLSLGKQTSSSHGDGRMRDCNFPIKFPSTQVSLMLHTLTYCYCYLSCYILLHTTLCQSCVFKFFFLSIYSFWNMMWSQVSKQH